MPFPVVLDACVLAPAPLYDVLLRMAEKGMYRPIWSQDILNETWRTMVHRLCLSEEKANHRLSMMSTWFVDASTTGYQQLIPSMKNDPKDRHVLAVAVRQRAEVIVTANLCDFPTEALDPFGIKAVHPDEFLLDQLDLYRAETLAVLHGLVASYQNPRIQMGELLETMQTRELPKFASEASGLLQVDL